MKKTTLALGSLLALGLVANTFAQTTNVYSKNAVGYVNLNLSTTWTLISIPLGSTGAAPLTIDDVFGTNVAEGTEIWFFSPVGQSYSMIFYVVGEGWYTSGGTPNQGTNTLERGDGYWIHLPDATPLPLPVVGEVPGAQYAATTPFAVKNGFRLFSYPYPVAVNITNTVLHAQALEGDEVWAWTGDDYQGYYTVEGGWYTLSGTPSTIMLQPGRSYWYRSTSDRNVNETKPYNWP